MGVIVVGCAAFGLTVSEAKTEIMCLRAKGMVESTATFSVEAAGQMYNQTNEFVYLGGNVNQNTDLSFEVDRRVRNAWCSFQNYTLEQYNRPSAPLELKLWMLRAKVLDTILYSCVTWSPRACYYDTPCRADSLHQLMREQSHGPPDFLFGHASHDGTANRALFLSSNSECSEPRYSTQHRMAVSRGARVRATTTRCAKPTIAS